MSRRPYFPPARSRCRLVLSLAIGLATVVSSGLDAAPRKTFGGVTSSVSVEVPVEVLLEGKPVRGLTRESFEIRDGGEPREIVGFEVVDLERPRPGRVVPISGRRHFLLLFDLSFSQPQAIERSREAARGLIRDDFAPEDLVAVATYSLSNGVRWVLPFTLDRHQAVAAVESLGLPSLIERPTDALGLVLGRNLAKDVTAGPQTGSRGGGGGGAGRGGSKGGYAAEVTAALERVARAAEATNQEQQRRQVENLTRSMAEMAESLAGLEGRKHVVFLSEGFESSLLAGETDEQQRQELSRAVAQHELWKVSSEDLFGSRRMADALTTMVEQLQRADCTVHALDIGGLRSEDSGLRGGRDREGLALLARDTGGEMIQNTNDLSRAMNVILDRTSVIYVLSFQADDLEEDGDWRRLKVRVKGLPRKAKVHHRPGYFAPSSSPRESPMAQRLAVARRLAVGAEGGEIEADLTVLPVAGGSPVALRASVSALDLEADAEVHLYAFDEGEGTVLDFVSRRLTFEAGQLRFVAPLDLPPGVSVVRALVRIPDLGWNGLRRMRVVVPADGADPPRLVAVVAAEDATTPAPRLITRPELPTTSLPFSLGEQAFYPSNRIRPPESTAVRVPVVLLGRGIGENLGGFRARVEAQDGFPVSGSSFALLAQAEGTDGWDRILGLLSIPAGWTGPLTLVVEGGGLGQAALNVEPGTSERSWMPWEALGGVAPEAAIDLVAIRDRPLEALEPAVRDELDLEISRDRRTMRRAMDELYRRLGGEDRDLVLEAFEQMELDLTADPKNLDRWFSLEGELAKRISRREPELLVPMLAARHDLVRRYRSERKGILAHHALAAAVNLADLVARKAGRPDLAAAALASLGGDLQKGLVATCLRLFDQALSHRPEYPAALLGRATFLEKRGGPYEEVIRDLERLLDARPDHREARLRLAVNRSRVGDTAAAQTLYRKLFEADVEDWIGALATAESARLLLSSGDVETALVRIEAGLARWPQDQKLRILRVYALDRAGRGGDVARAAEDTEGSAAQGLRVRTIYQDWPSEDLERARFDLATAAEELRPALTGAFRASEASR